MKAKVVRVNKVAKKEVSTKNEENVRRGRNSKRKGNQYERDVAKAFKEAYGLDLKRTPQSGGFAKKSDKADEFRGDIILVDDTKEFQLHIECKNTKTWSLPKWLRQVGEDKPEGRVPLVVFHQYGTPNDYVCLNLKDFLDIVPLEKIVREKV